MGTLGKEAQIVQNPALGAMLLWRFTDGYEHASNVSNPTPIPLLFIVLPIMLHKETSSLVESTMAKSGLRAFANKFSDSRVAKNDLIFAINERAIEMRKHSMESLKIAVSSNLMAIDIARGVAIPLSSTQRWRTEVRQTHVGMG